MKIAVSTGNSRMDKKWNLTEMELEDFGERISKTQRTAETMEQYEDFIRQQRLYIFHLVSKDICFLSII